MSELPKALGRQIQELSMHNLRSPLISIIAICYHGMICADLSPIQYKEMLTQVHQLSDKLLRCIDGLVVDTEQSKNPGQAGLDEEENCQRLWEAPTNSVPTWVDDDAYILVVGVGDEETNPWLSWLDTIRVGVKRIATVIDAVEFLAVEAEELPVTVIIDVTADEEEAWLLIKSIKANPATEKMPVIVLAETDRSERAQLFDVDAFLMKPVDLEMLTNVLPKVNRIKQKLVTVIEDDYAQALEIEDRLRTFVGCRVVVWPNGTMAYQKLVEEKPDLILLDLILPDIGGSEILHYLKCHPELRCIPVIVSTAKKLSPVERAELETGNTMLWEKGKFRMEQLMQAIKRLLLGGTDRFS